MKIDRRWTVKATATDAARIARSARRVGMTVSAFVRAAAVARAEAVELLADADPKARAELIRNRLEKNPLRNIVGVQDLETVDGMTPRHDTEAPIK